MPQVLPRAKDLFFSGFSHVAFFMAQIYHSARLLPTGHPYLQPGNLGKYGIRHVIVEAGNNLVISKKNIDQIIIFGVLLAGIVILMMQFFLLGFSLFAQTAYAGAVPSTFAEYFLLADATHDVAFVLLDRVFGVPDFFVDVGRGQTCVAQGIPCFQSQATQGLAQSSRVITPDLTIYTRVTGGSYTLEPTAATNIAFPWGFHLALHSMFEAYSVGILLIAVFIFIYFVAAIIAETAQSGTPFGRRFNHVWAPLRIIAAIGLLVPLTHGLNSGQYILLFAAKWGSGFASNGWIIFNNAAISGADTMLGNTENLVAMPNVPKMNTLVEFGTILATCKHAYERMYYEREDRPEPMVIDAWLISPDDVTLAPRLLTQTDYVTALEYFNYGDIHVRFGELRDTTGGGGDYQTYDGQIAPYCGELKLEIHNGELLAAPREPGPALAQAFYYSMINVIWQAAAGNCGGGGYGAGNGFSNQGCIGENVTNRYLPIGNDPTAPLPDSGVLEEIRQAHQDLLDLLVNTAVTQQRNSPEWLEQLTDLGWGGAAVWYNKVAQLNGSMIGAVFSLPTIKAYPEIMEKTRKKRAGADSDAPGDTRHQVYQSADAPLIIRDEEEVEIGKALYITQTLWRDHYSEKKKGGNIWIDVVNAVFGTQGLFDMQENADLQIHPLAQLTAVGRTLVDTAIRNLGYSAAAGLGGGIVNLFGQHLAGRVAMTASGFLSQVAMIGISIGFVLYYVVPFLPFIYFFFAVGGWIKGIFEAMVGVPLWALAHLRIDGNGLPGDAALGGYQLIMEIFLRPILIVFGYLASITIFAAQVQILHEIWPLVVSNVSGFDSDAGFGNNGSPQHNIDGTGGWRFLRSAVDQFFFTVIYAIVVYMLAMSSFKMIDLVPNHILRWIGANVSTFGDQSGDPAQNLVRNSYIGANMVSGQVQGAIGGLRGAASSGGKAIAEIAGRTS